MNKFLSKTVVMILLVALLVSALTVSAAAKTYNANESLATAIEKKSFEGSAWTPVFQTSHDIGIWYPMVINGDVFGWNETAWNMPYVASTDVGVILNSNQWTSASWIDIAGLKFTAPEDGEATLTAGSIKKITNNDREDGASLDANEAYIVIYHNDRKIWPADKNYEVVKKGASVTFPTLTINLKAGDEIVIEASVGIGGDIHAGVNGEWKNDVIMDPQIVYGGEGAADGKNPKTGDTFNFAAVIALLGGSTAVFFLIRKKHA